MKAALIVLLLCQVGCIWGQMQNLTSGGNFTSGVNSTSGGNSTRLPFEPLAKGLNTTKSFNSQKENIMRTEAQWRFGSTQELTENDSMLNEIFKKHKNALLETAFKDESRFRPSRFMLDNNFSTSPNDTVYEILRRLPKGALLHSHLTANHDLATFPKMMLRLDNCQVCETNTSYELRYFDEGVRELSSEFKCRRCPSENDTAAFEKEATTLQHKLSMYDGHDYSVENIQYIWEKFEKKFGPTGNAKDTWHVWKAMFNSALTTLVKDNIQYAEFRTGFGDLFHANGSVVPYEDVLAHIEATVAEFRDQNPNFYGINLVLSKGRVGLSDAKLRAKLEAADGYFRKSDLIRAFDLVGSEETGRTLKSVLNILTQWRDESNSTMPFAFHAGETLWTGFEADENVVYAVLLDSKRIGHGYALDAHPYVLEMVRQQEVGIELNPISNQVLALVDDIRNHRNKRLMDVANKPGDLSSNPLRFSVNSDDCLILGTKPMTDDLYMTILAMTSKDSDLRQVKRLAYDSIYISLLSDEEKAHLTTRFEQEWDHVVMELILDDLRKQKSE